MKLVRIAFIIAVSAAATSQLFAHGGHGAASNPSGLFHYLVSHGLGVALILAFIALVWCIGRRLGRTPNGVNGQTW